VGVYLEFEASALANAFYQAIYRVRCERAAALGREGTLWELPAQFSRGPYLIAPKLTSVEARTAESAPGKTSIIVEFVKPDADHTQYDQNVT
jgi:hypothetical protein